MSIANSVKNILQGMGISGLANSASFSTTVATSAVTVTCTLPAGALANYGLVRCKISAVTAGNVASVLFTATDGTTTIQIPDPVTVVGTPATGYEIVRQFCSDLNLQTFVAVVTGASSFAGVRVDYEVWGNLAAGGVAGTSSL